MKAFFESSDKKKLIDSIRMVAEILAITTDNSFAKLEEYHKKFGAGWRDLEVKDILADQNKKSPDRIISQITKPELISFLVVLSGGNQVSCHRIELNSTAFELYA
jgi:hypothetical protein